MIDAPSATASRTRRSTCGASGIRLPAKNESGVTFRIAITRGCEKSNKGLFAAMAENPVEFNNCGFEVFLEGY